MKKVVILFSFICILVLSTGCSNTDKKEEQPEIPKTPEVSEKASIKIDKDKPFYTIETLGDYDLFTLLEENGRVEEGGTNNFGEWQIDKIYLNISTDSAKELEKSINSKAEEQYELREKTIENIISGDFFRWYNYSILNIYEDEYTLTFSLRDQTVIFGSEGYGTYNTYVFDLESGELMSQEDILKRMNLSYDAIATYLQKDSSQFIFSEEEVDESEIMEQGQKSNWEIPYVFLSGDNEFGITEEGLSVNLCSYSAMSGECAYYKTIIIPEGFIIID